MPELIAAYPSAKVVITPRDPDSWYKSCMDTVIRMKYSLPLTICRTLDPKTRMLHNMLDKIFGGLFGGREGFVECGKEVYLEKLDEVRRLVPKERLLEYKLGDGWEPLCEFLGNDVPDTPFPRVNDTAEFGVRVQVMGKMAMERVAKTYLAPVGAAVALATAYYVYF